MLAVALRSAGYRGRRGPLRLAVERENEQHWRILYLVVVRSDGVRLGVQERRVWTVEKRSRRKRVILGALIGFGGGCAIGANRAGYVTDINAPPASMRAQVCLVVGALTGAAGAGIAAAIPSARRTLVYRAAEPE